MAQTTGRAFGSGSNSGETGEWCSDSGAGVAPRIKVFGSRCWDNLVDGRSGINSWCPSVNGDKAGVVLPHVRTIVGIRPINTDHRIDGGMITVEYSATANSDSTPWSSSSGWVHAGNISDWPLGILGANTRDFYYLFSTPVAADGLRITLANTSTTCVDRSPHVQPCICVDELEVYAVQEQTPPTPPPSGYSATVSVDMTIYPGDVVSELHEDDMHKIAAAVTAIVGPPNDVDIATVNLHETAPGVVRVIAYSTSANSTAIIAQYFSGLTIEYINHM